MARSSVPPHAGGEEAKIVSFDPTVSSGSIEEARVLDKGRSISSDPTKAWELSYEIRKERVP